MDEAREISRVIFLDVDGVLNNEAAWSDRSQQGPWRLDKACVARFNRMVQKSGAAVVISSSWRGIETGEAKLLAAGVFKHRHSDGSTSRLNWHSPGGVYLAKTRGDEIEEWLSRHPEVTSYVIIDDESDMLDHQKPRLIQTDFHEGGLQDEHVERVLALLAVEGLPK